MIILLLAADALAGPAPNSVAAPAIAAPPAAAAAAPPPAAPAPTKPPPSIDSLLKPGSDQTTDTDEEPTGGAAPQGPVPYSQLDTKAYDEALRNGAAAGRAMAGTLDGGWTLAASDGERLYRFQFVGHGGMEQADGAWRDLKGEPGLKDSGFVDQVGYSGDRLMLRFFETSAGGQVEVSVKPSGSGPWSGELKRGTTVVQVTFKRE